MSHNQKVNVALVISIIFQTLIALKLDSCEIGSDYYAVIFTVFWFATG